MAVIPAKLKTLRHLTVVLLGLLFGFYWAYWAGKLMQAWANRNLRQHSEAMRFVAEHLPPNSRVVGGAEYYYAVLNAESDFQYFDQYNDLPTRERQHRESWDYTHFILSELSQIRRPTAVSHYLAMSSFDTVGVWHPQESRLSAMLNQWLPLSPMERPGYRAIILKRQRFAQP